MDKRRTPRTNKFIRELPDTAAPEMRYQALLVHCLALEEELERERDQVHELCKEVVRLRGDPAE